MTAPLVALGIPAGDRVHTEFAECLWGLGRGARTHRQGTVVGRSSMVVSARNNVVDGARKIGADWLMFLDSDMTFPYTIVDKLLAHKKDIVGCTYVRRGPPFDNLGHTVDPKDMTCKTGLVEMTHMPTGLLLINMKVFESFTQPIFAFERDEVNGITVGEDMLFSRQARERGFKLWCDLDLSMECAHMFQYALRPTDPALRATAEKYKAEQAA